MPRCVAADCRYSGAVNGLMREVIKGHLLEHVVLEEDKTQREKDMEVVLKVLDSYIK